MWPTYPIVASGRYRLLLTPLCVVNAEERQGTERIGNMRALLPIIATMSSCNRLDVRKHDDFYWAFFF